MTYAPCSHFLVIYLEINHCFSLQTINLTALSPGCAPPLAMNMHNTTWEFLGMLSVAVATVYLCAVTIGCKIFLSRYTTGGTKG